MFFSGSLTDTGVYVCVKLVSVIVIVNLMLVGRSAKAGKSGGQTVRAGGPDGLAGGRVARQVGFFCSTNL